MLRGIDSQAEDTIDQDIATCDTSMESQSDADELNSPQINGKRSSSDSQGHSRQGSRIRRSKSLS